MMTFMEKTMVVFRRFMELLFFTVVASAAIALMKDAGAVKEPRVFAIIVLAIFLAFLITNVNQTRTCYLDLQSKGWHYALNIIAYLLFAGVTYLLYNFAPHEVYRMTMSLGNIIRYAYTPCPVYLSAIIFHVITFIVLLFAPVGMDEIIASVSWEGSDEDES